MTCCVHVCRSACVTRWLARRFTVQIESAPLDGAGQARYIGKLGSEAAGGEGRTVSGGSCREVADALTLIAALEMQPNAPIAAPPVLSEPDAMAEAGRRDVTEDAPPEANGQRDPARLRIAAAGFALLQSTSAPRMTADLGVGVTLSWQAESFQPWLLLGVYWGDDEVRVRSGGAAAAQFERWSTYVVGCPLRFPRRSAAGVRPCASVDLGRLSGEGQDVRLARESSSLLASAGLDLRIEWTVLERIELGALLGGVLTLSRPRFFFSPEITALDTSPLGLRTGATASVSF